MAWRAGILAACLALPNITSDPHNARDPHETSLDRQNLDAASGFTRRAYHSIPHERQKAAQQLSARSQLRSHEIDVLATQLSFNSARIAELDTAGVTTLYLPGVGDLQLEKLAKAEHHGALSMRFRHGDLVGTVTQRGQEFMMTLPTVTDNFRIHGDAHQSWAVSSRQLAQRTVNQEKDFQHAP